MEGKGLAVVKIDTMYVPLWPCFYSPKSKHSIIGVSAIKSFQHFRSIRIEVNDWIRFVDEHARQKSVWLRFNRELINSTQLDFIEAPFVHILPSNSSSFLPPTPSVHNLTYKTPTNWTIIHRRLGHIGDSTLAWMCRQKKIPGLPSIFPTKHHLQDKCTICAQGKLRSAARGEVVDTTHYQPGQLLHADFCFMNKPSICGFTCVLVIVDARTRRLWVFCTPNKRPPVDILRYFLHTLRHEGKNNGRGVQFMRTDKGGELARNTEI